MEMIKCPNCGKDTNSGSNFCSNCGARFTAGKIATVKKKRKLWPWVLLAIVIIVLLGKPTNESNDKSTSDSKQETEKTDVYQIPKETFIEIAENIPYKELSRNPEDHTFKTIILTVKIQQIVQGGLLDDNQYYRVYTNDDIGLWLGDEYFMYDSRYDKSMNLLQNDIIKVYAKYMGTQTITRALTNTKEEVPAIQVYYVELVEEEKEEENDEILNDGIVDITFNEFSVKYDSYELTTDYAGNSCVIIYYNYTNNSTEAQSAAYCVDLKAFQDGISCDTTVVFDNEFLNNSTKEVMQGTTIKIGEAFKLSSENDLLIEVSEFISFNKRKDSMTIAIK